MTKLLKCVNVAVSLVWIAFSISAYAGAKANLSFDCVDNGTKTTCSGSMQGARDSADSTRYALFAKLPMTVSGTLQDAVVFQAVTNGQSRVCLFSPSNVTNDIISALAPDANQYFVVEMPSGGGFSLCSAFRSYRSSLYLP